MVPKILGAFPEHDQYWELFCGTCQMFKRKKHVESFLVDKNSFVVHEAMNNYQGLGSYEFLHVDVFEVIQNIIDKNSYYGHKISNDAFIFMDPPWRVSKLGSKKKLYKYSLSDNETAKLLSLSRKLKSKVAILHYTDELYDDILDDWFRKDFNVSYSGRVCSISLYCNYDFTKVKTHLPTLSGKNNTDRQRIKRKAKRWVNSLLRLPIYEQQVIIDQIKSNFSI